MFREGYEVFVSHPDELEKGKELQLEIRDCENYRYKVVKALVSPPQEKLAQGEPLWVRGNIGYLVSEEPWKIKITQVIEER